MEITKIRVIDRNGQPVQGIYVLLSDNFDSWKETDEDGKVAYQFEDGTALASLIAIKSAGGTPITGHIVIEAGQTVDVVATP